MHIALSIVVAFVVIGVILALLEIRPIREAIEVIGGLVLVIGGSLLMLAFLVAVGWLALVYAPTMVVEAGAEREVKQFAADTKKHPHFKELRDTMREYLDKNRASDLESAYQAALQDPRHANLRADRGQR